MALIKKAATQAVEETEVILSYNDYEKMLLSNLVDDRRLAVRGLSSLRDARVLPTLIALLSGEKDASVQELILQMLRTQGGDAVVNALVTFLRSDDAHLRNSVIDVLQQMPAEMGTHMEGLLVDSDPDVRIFAINIMASLEHASIPHWLETVITQDAHLNVCMTALDLLAETGDDGMCDSVNQLLTRFPDEPYVAFSVTQVKKRLGCST